MVVILKKNAPAEQVERFQSWLTEHYQLEIHESIGQNCTLLGLVGDTTRVDIDLLQAMEIVENVRRIGEPYKFANRKMHPQDTVVDCGGVPIGGGHFTIVAGPCSVESEEQILYVAQRVKAAGAGLLRGGAFKPRTSPYAFQGLRGEGIRLDAMFIDEGFGSLDENALRQAIELLGRLADGKRLIGVISHMPELKERIDRKIIVRKRPGGSELSLDLGA